VSAILEVGRRLLTERDPSAVLRSVCLAARELTGARMALIGVTSDGAGRIERIVSDISALPPAAVHQLPDSVLRSIEMRRPARTAYAPPGGEPIAMMVAPFATAHQVYGWLALLDKPAGFEDADEQMATSLATLGATAYENAILHAHVGELEFALSVARVGLSYRDIDADHIVVSRSLAELLDLPAGTRSISRGDFLQRVHPDDAQRVDATVREAVSAGTEFNLEYRLQAGDRGWRWFRSNGRVRINVQGRQRVFSAIADVTERRSLESQLQQAQKMEALGQLAGGVAHDFNNFLTAILGYAQFLVDSAPSEAQRHDAGEIVKAADRAASLTKQLLAFGRRQVMETEIIDVNALVVDIAGMLRRIIGEDIELTTAPGAKQPLVKAGRGQLEQVVMNLVVNARDAIDGAGSIHIETADGTFEDHVPLRPAGATSRCVTISVTDTGCGMDEETKARLFEPFFTTKPRTQGSGLGLATVYGIVSHGGGSLSVTSDPGRGATFRIHLPLHEEPLGEPFVPVAPPVTRGVETVLLAEDEPAVRRLARRILERAGYSVVEAGGPGEAEAVAESLGQIDLLLTDVIMPGGTGPELARRLSARRPGMRILFMSGYAERDLFDRDALSTTDAFIAKPFSADALVAKVRLILDR
jgi:signal transduction histidine kinase/CheY-like chemotaxis protein